jgi:hypothetical protein
MTIAAPVRLSARYEAEYAAYLAAIAATPGIPPELNMFWPKVGARYVGDVLVIGKATNGWIDRWVPGERPDTMALARIARATAEDGVNGDQLGWVLDQWQRRDDRYDTSRSQFWQTIRRVSQYLRPDTAQDWPSVVAWTNLVKVGPWNKGNPAGHLLGVQLREGPRLLAREIEDLNPRLVVALTGGGWFRHFSPLLGLDFDWHGGLVEGVQTSGARRWVIAVHPMTRSPEAVANAIVDARPENRK